ncbi:MAG: bifunctional diaminohydroxyphosphoribosylaminopyrimidine deaminase/5-amino-6-(5-phosphoribosylamino)uracil reductase RibD [Candidatus Omnitrophota bacterium]
MRHADEQYIRFSLDLARKAKGLTSPNPCVGAVVVKDGRIVGKGYHKRAGGPHAEIFALRQAGKYAKGATLYVSLEPCGHYGRTPPCADLIISSGIKRVVTAMKDPNPLNNGKSLAFLRKNGIKTDVGILKQEAEKLNEEFIKFITKRIPFVTVKVAQSLDGKIASRTGDSKWISGEEARNYVHTLRSRTDAVIIGIGTLLMDDPLLTARPIRQKPARQPLRIVLDSRLKIPLTARILNSAGGKVIIATTEAAGAKKIDLLRRRGVDLIVVNQKNDVVDIKSLLVELGKREISSVLIEGGGEVIASAMESKTVDKVLFFISPKIIGGRQALTSVEGVGVKCLKDSFNLKESRVEKIGGDFLFEGYMEY